MAQNEVALKEDSQDQDSELDSEPAKGYSHFAGHPVRCLLQWTGLGAGIAMEVCIHLRYGLSNQTFEAEEECELADGDVPYRCQALTIFEIICRVCLTVALSAMLWEFTGAVSHRQADQCLLRTFFGKHSKKRYIVFPMMLSISLAIVGSWNVLAEDSLPSGGALVCHLADILCHGIVMSALAGLAWDGGVAIHAGTCGKFMRNFALCNDTIEAHGVADADADSSHSEASHASVADLARSSVDVGRTVLIWIFTLMVFVGMILDSYYPDVLPTWASTALALEGTWCWAGIAWWIGSSLPCCCSEKEDSEKEEEDEEKDEEKE